MRRPGANWSFTLPEGHTIEIEDDVVTLRAMPHASSRYRLERVEETDEERIVHLGRLHARSGGPPKPEITRPEGYPLPEIQDEIERLRTRWRDAGLPEQGFTAYGEGETHEEHLREIRRTLRASPTPS